MQVPTITRPPALEPPAVTLFQRPPAVHIRAVPPELPFQAEAAAETEPAAEPAAAAAAAAAAEPTPGRRPPTVSFEPQTTPRAALPDPVSHARALVQALLEVLSGRRSVRQLRPHLTEEAYQRLAGRLQRARAAAGAVRSPKPKAHRPPGRTRIHIGRTLLCEPADGIAEVTVLADVGSRTRAIAVRLEGLDGRWRCPVLTIL